MSEEYIPPKGKRYSQLFLERYRGQSDSKTLRKRIISTFTHHFGEYENMVDEVGQTIQRRIGADIQYNRFHGNPMLTWFFTDCKIYEVNDAITVIAEVLKLYKEEFADIWLKEVNEIYIEEGMPYCVVGNVVEPYIDEAFSHNQVTLLSGLKADGLEDVRENVSSAYKNFRQTEIASKAAIAYMVEALTSYLKLKVGISTLGEKDINQHLLPKLQDMYAKDQTALKASNQMVMAFCNWVEANQQYGQGEKDGSEQPPTELAVLMVDQGTGFLRWLLDVFEAEKEA